MSFKEFMKELNGNRVEGELVKTIVYSLITSAITLASLYFIKLKNIENFLPKYSLALILIVISYALILTTVRQVRAYREMACMSGMMVGMTTGMIAGFLPGFYLASTNGMFVGSVSGMFLGISMGIWNGKCCGVMGIMEGIMAGFMGGLMGAMTAFMLLNDHLKTTSVLVLTISAVIIIGLNYMIYKEMKETERQMKEDHFITIILTFLLTVITIWLMVFGPRSGIFG